MGIVVTLTDPTRITRPKTEKLAFQDGVAFFDLGDDFYDILDVAIKYQGGKAIIHIDSTNSDLFAEKGYQIGEELALDFSVITDSSGSYLLKIQNSGNAADIQITEIQTKLFGGL